MRTILVLLIAVSSLLVQADERLSPSIESARVRWERFSPEEKERARARYERFLAMTEEEREQLRESARRLSERTERVQKDLAREEGTKLAAMDPGKRQALVREMVADESRAVGARIRGQLPQSLLSRLEKARPEDRARFFREFRMKQRNRVARYAIGSLGKDLGLPAGEIRRMQELPGPERCEAVLELRKRLSEKDVQSTGLPPGITQAEWDAWLELPPEQFFEVFERNREARIFAQEKREAVRALFEASRPHPGEVIALADLTPEARRERIQAQRRERCTRVLREGHLVAAAELEALVSQTDADFFATVRRLLWKSTGLPWRRLRQLGYVDDDTDR